MMGWMMPDVFKIFRKQKSLAEIEEDTERAESEARLKDAEYTVAQKQAMIVGLKKRGLQPKHFGSTSQTSTWKRIWAWLKSH